MNGNLDRSPHGPAPSAQFFKDNIHAICITAMTDHTKLDSLEHLRERLADFAAQREWEPFHSPKNLAMALIAEAAELVEHFQWLTEEQSRTLSPEQKHKVSLELADILIYLIRTADQLEIDLIGAANEKIAINEHRYPAEKVRGSAKRASEYDD
jgi:dCTP diphosphatase